MKQFKILIALSSIDIYERNAYLKFVKSDFFNGNQTLIDLATLYIDYLKTGTQHLLSKDLIWEEIFTGSYDDKKLRYANSELLKLFEKYRFYAYLETQKFTKDVQQFISIVELDETKLYESKRKKITKTFEETRVRDSEYFLEKFHFEKAVYQLNVTNQKDHAKQVANLNIINSSDALDTFYAIEKLKLYSNLLTWKRIYKVDSNIDFIELVMRYSRSKWTDSAYVMTILSIVDMQIKQSNESYYDYKDQLINNLDLIKPLDLREFFEAGFNFCIARTNRGDTSFQKEALELYKLSIDRRLMILDDRISRAAFNNIVYFALKEDESEWATDFIYKYSPYLNDYERESTKSYSLARVAYVSDDFKSAIRHLSNVEFTSVVTTINAKVMQLFSYYELKEENALDSLINSFRVYLNREKTISNNRKTSYKNLLQFLKKIVHVNPNDKAKIKKLREEIENNENVASKSWLVEKVGELL